jgi:hypothetical protein
VLTLGLSFANKYNVRPLASARVLPRDVWWTDIAEFAATAGGFLALDPFETISATAAATMSAMTVSDSRVRFMTGSFAVSAENWAVNCADASPTCDYCSLGMTS